EPEPSSPAKRFLQGPASRGGRGPDRRRRRKKGQGRRPGRARRLTGRGFKQAATAKEGPGRAPHPGAAPHGAEVQAGGDGGNGVGAVIMRGGVAGTRRRGPEGATSA